MVAAVEIDLRCRACGHDWTDEMNKGALASAELHPPVVLRPKADRRNTRR